jgi:hypothetical protein
MIPDSDTRLANTDPADTDLRPAEDGLQVTDPDPAETGQTDVCPRGAADTNPENTHIEVDLATTDSVFLIQLTLARVLLMLVRLMLSR